MQRKIFKHLAIAILLIGINTLVNGQAKKLPSIMVIPSENFCISNGYFTEFENQGKKSKLPDYARAFQENSDLGLVIAKLGEMMSNRGFPLTSMEQLLKANTEESAEDAITTSTATGSGVAVSPLDKLLSVAKSDILMELTYNYEVSGPKKQVVFRLSGLDSYTSKQVASASGTGQPSFSAPAPVLLEEAVLSHIDNFNTQLQAHFESLFLNGREVTLRIRRFESFEGNLESEYEGKELREIIEDWVSNNTVNKSFSITNNTADKMDFNQVRIPMLKNDKGLDANNWARDLQKYLKATFKIESKIKSKGLGTATIIIGQK